MYKLNQQEKSRSKFLILFLPTVDSSISLILQHYKNIWESFWGKMSQFQWTKSIVFIPLLLKWIVFKEKIDICHFIINEMKINCIDENKREI